MKPDLFSVARRKPERDAEPPPALLDHRARTVAYITATPGCHDCRHWTRANAATGHCGEIAARLGLAGDAHPWLTSYAYCCPAHPARAS